MNNPKRIAIIGFGFSGLMVLAHLVTRTAEKIIVYVIAPDLSGHGVAYSTTDTHHLLNVTADRMSAFADDKQHLLHWLESANGAAAKKRLHLTRDYGENDFIPRVLFAAYLDDIWRNTQEIAAQKKLEIKLVQTTATSLTTSPFAVHTERGDAIAVDELVLASGHEPKPILPHIPKHYVVQNPWAENVWKDAKHWQAPVMLMGLGLTAVDAVLSLRAAGYLGPIIAFSRNGLLPQSHKLGEAPLALTRNELLAHKTLGALLLFLRSKARAHGAWRPVIEALRPHTQLIWQRLSTQDQQRFHRRLTSIWGVHRHRMAPEIAEKIAAEMARGGLRVIASKKLTAEMKDDHLTVTLTQKNGEAETFSPSHIINCTGPEMQMSKVTQPLLAQALADGVIEAHANGIGLAADPHHRAWGSAYPHVYAMGSLMVGQLRESVAVPELRGQAATIAKSLLADFSA